MLTLVTHEQATLPETFPKQEKKNKKGKSTKKGNKTNNKKITIKKFKFQLQLARI